MTTAAENDGDTLVEERVEEQVDEQVDEKVEYRYEDGDHERFSHYILRDQQMQSMIEGTPVRALCGKVWVPSRDPKRFPVCPECKEIAESLPAE